MAGYYFCPLTVGFAEQFKAAGGYISVGRSVKTVAADIVFFVILIRDCKHIRFWRNGLMKSGVEYRHLRYIGAERGGCGANSLHMRLVVQG